MILVYNILGCIFIVLAIILLIGKNNMDFIRKIAARLAFESLAVRENSWAKLPQNKGEI